ncbi:NACHT, LRR and PYD domains-containing 3-like, partial [Paramuricea clavata]
WKASMFGKSDRKTLLSTLNDILVIGRPGIGKTVLTQKILRDWAEATNQINEYYCDKIAFSFKLRWFNNTLEKISLKTFLQFGTGLSKENFESIYEEITKKPQKAILIFDGLDEFHGNPINCLVQSTMIPNDPNACMSAMNIFVKLFWGDLLKGATVLVTSRPTADDFYSRLDFDRNVEIIGFTSNKIEEYVSRFCIKNNKTDLEVKIWEHIKTSSELLNLCYIPVNCFIVCVILSGCLSEPQNETNTLPTTLTKLYQNALRYYEKYDNDRDTEGNPMITEEILKKLQLLAFRGMKNHKLIFDQESVDKQMKKSCLLNSLSNPIFPIQTQFCFIHLTIQEFLAARHVTETLAPPEIKKFISDHVRSGRWRLVLQFIAGLLESFKVIHDRCIPTLVKALQDEHCQLTVLSLGWNAIGDEGVGMLFEDALTKEHCKLTELNLSSCSLTDRCIPSLRDEDRCIPSLCKALQDERCQLTVLKLASNAIGDKGCSLTDQCISSLCKALQDKHCQLTVLKLASNAIGDEGADRCIPSLCKALQDEHCQLTDLLLGQNAIGDKDVDRCIPSLCKALQDERCK